MQTVHTKWPSIFTFFFLCLYLLFICDQTFAILNYKLLIMFAVISCFCLLILFLIIGKYTNVSLVFRKGVRLKRAWKSLFLLICRYGYDKCKLNFNWSIYASWMGAQWLSGRVLDSRPKGRGFEPHRRHWVVVLEQDTFILA